MPLYEGLGITDKDIVVVLDIGTAYTKSVKFFSNHLMFSIYFCRMGFCGEFAPRYIIPSEVTCKTTNKNRKLFDFENAEDLYDLLVQFLSNIYFK